MLHHTAHDLENIGSKFCDVLVGTLLEGGSHSACHGASVFDSPLKGNKDESILTVIR